VETFTGGLKVSVAQQQLSLSLILLMVQKSQTTTWHGAKTLKIMGNNGKKTTCPSTGV